MARPVVHWEIGSPDSDRLGAFYREVFGWVLESGDGYDYVDTGGEVGIDGGLRHVPGVEDRYLALYVQVEDVESTLRHAEESGGRVLMEPADAGAGKAAMFSDPDGNVVGLLAPGAGTG